MFSVPISSDAHCDGLPSDPSYELTCLGSIQSASTKGEENPQKNKKGESTVETTQNLPPTSWKPREQRSLFLNCHDTFLGLFSDFCP